MPPKPYQGFSKGHGSNKVTTFKIYLSHLPDSSKSSDIRTMFEEFGRVVECEVFKKNYGFVHMEEATCGRKAVLALNRKLIDGCEISVCESKNSEGPNIPTTRLHVRNLPPNCSPTYLRAQFQKFGLVIETEIIKKGEGIVSLEAIGDIRSAINEMNGSVLEGYMIDVSAVRVNLKEENKAKISMGGNISGMGPSPPSNRGQKVARGGRGGVRGRGGGGGGGSVIGRGGLFKRGALSGRLSERGGGRGGRGGGGGAMPSLFGGGYGPEALEEESYAQAAGQEDYYDYEEEYEEEEGYEEGYEEAYEPEPVYQVPRRPLMRPPPPPHYRGYETLAPPPMPPSFPFRHRFLPPSRAFQEPQYGEEYYEDGYEDYYEPPPPPFYGGGRGARGFPRFGPPPRGLGFGRGRGRGLPPPHGPVRPVITKKVGRGEPYPTPPGPNRTLLGLGLGHKAMRRGVGGVRRGSPAGPRMAGALSSSRGGGGIPSLLADARKTDAMLKAKLQGPAAAGAKPSRPDIDFSADIDLG